MNKTYATYRDIPRRDISIGQRIRVGDAEGTIVHIETWDSFQTGLPLFDFAVKFDIPSKKYYGVKNGHGNPILPAQQGGWISVVQNDNNVTILGEKVVQHDLENYQTIHGTPITDLSRNELIIELAKAIDVIEELDIISSAIGEKISQWRFGRV